VRSQSTLAAMPACRTVPLLDFKAVGCDSEKADCSTTLLSCGHRSRNILLLCERRPRRDVFNTALCGLNIV